MDSTGRDMSRRGGDVVREVIPLSEDFKPVATVDDVPGYGSVMVGEDLRLYRKAKGLLELIVECEPREKTKPGMWFTKINKDDYPPVEELSHLFDTFLSNYQREVMYVVGQRYDNGTFFYMVPNQVGTPASIEWKDKKGMNWFSKYARFLGTVHIHPGNCASPSSIDITGWEEKLCSGIHMIFGRDGKFTMHASIAGHVVWISDGDIKDTKRKRVPLYRSLNLSFNELLNEPPPVKIIKFSQQGFNRRLRRGKSKKQIGFQTTGRKRDRWIRDGGVENHYEREWEDMSKEIFGPEDGIGDILEETGALSVEIDDPQQQVINGIRVVIHDGKAWLMTEDQYDEYCEGLSLMKGDISKAPSGREVHIQLEEEIV